MLKKILISSIIFSSLVAVTLLFVHSSDSVNKRQQRKRRKVRFSKKNEIFRYDSKAPIRGE